MVNYYLYFFGLNYFQWLHRQYANFVIEKLLAKMASTCQVGGLLRPFHLLQPHCPHYPATHLVTLPLPPGHRPSVSVIAADKSYVIYVAARITRPRPVVVVVDTPVVSSNDATVRFLLPPQRRRRGKSTVWCRLTPSRQVANLGTGTRPRTSDMHANQLPGRVTSASPHALSIWQHGESWSNWKCIEKVFACK